MIGGGAMTREHIRAFRDVPGVEIAGICNRTREKARGAGDASSRFPYVASSIADLHAKTNADLAVRRSLRDRDQSDHEARCWRIHGRC